jgi:hypothetical protein
VVGIKHLHDLQAGVGFRDAPGLNVAPL